MTTDRTDRLPLFDNARGLLIVLVAVGHSLEPLLRREPLAQGLYGGLYLFHIPAFAALSGHLSQATLNARRIRAIFATVGAPLLISQGLYVAFDVFALGHPFSRQHLDRPYWILWFLLSLLIWRLLLPVLVRTRVPLLLSLMIALAAGAAPWIGYPFGLSRTCVFLPCFVAGFLFRREWLPVLRSRAARLFASVAAIALFAFIGAVALGKRSPLDTRWLYGSASYSEFGVSILTGMRLRGVQLTLALLLTLAFFALCPDRSGPLTGFGGRSLAPFLLHGFCVRGLAQTGAFDHLRGAGGVVVVVLGGALLALALGTPPVARLTRPLWAPLRPALRSAPSRR